MGLYAAWTLQRRLKKRAAEIVIVSPHPYMTYQPFMPEVAAGNIQPRHAVASLRRTLNKCTVIVGSVTGMDQSTKRATITPKEGPEYSLAYDHAVIALGAVAKMLPIPGLEEMAMEFKTIDDAVALQNQVLGKLEAAASVWDHDLRRRQLTFTFVGGGFAGVEAIAEAEEMVNVALRDHGTIRREDVKFVLVEGADRILPEVGSELAQYALKQLRERGVEVKLNTFMDSCVDGLVETSDGDQFESDTVVWTAGMKPNPVMKQLDVPLDEIGRITTAANFQAVDSDGHVVPGLWAAGDCAAVPDLALRKAGHADATCAPTAQHAVRQAKLLGKNVARAVEGSALEDYFHASLGTVASMGLYRGVAQLGSIKLRGFPAWFMHRTYHMMAMPTVRKKVQVVADWTLALFTRRDAVPVGDTREQNFKKPASGQ